jgi:hypothetical protein
MIPTPMNARISPKSAYRTPTMMLALRTPTWVIWYFIELAS